MQNSQQLEVHYYLKDEAHSMDAFIRNKCEAELLAAFQHMALQLGFDLVLETSAHEEGGIRDRIKFLLRVENLAYATLLVALLNTAVTVWNAPPKPDKELEAAQKQLLQLTIQEKKITNAKLLREEEQGTPPATATSAIPPAQPTDANVPIDEPALTVIEKVGLQMDLRMRTKRSNFYKLLMPYDKVLAVGFSVVPEDELEPVEEYQVPHSDFGKFILHTDKLPSEIIPAAEIEIVAPVITEGDINWKGIWKGDSINFAMGDLAFKGSVMRREVRFQNGDAIICHLEIEKKLDDAGEPKITGYKVKTVLTMVTGNVATDTPQGKAKRYEDKHAADQRPLFDPDKA